MKRQFTLLLIALMTSLTSLAYNFAGKTYQSVNDDFTMTVSFTATRCNMKLEVPGEKPSTLSGRYEVSGEIINVYTKAGGDYFYIDTRKEYGEDCLFVLDPNGNLFMVLHRITTPTPKATTGKKSKRRR